MIVLRWGAAMINGVVAATLAAQGAWVPAAANALACVLGVWSASLNDDDRWF